MTTYLFWKKKFLSIEEAYGALIALLLIFYFFHSVLNIFVQKVLTVSSKFRDAHIKDIKQTDSKKGEFGKTYIIKTDIKAD